MSVDIYWASFIQHGKDQVDTAELEKGAGAGAGRPCEDPLHTDLVSTDV